MDCAWAPDGLTLAAALGDGGVELVDARSSAAAVRRLGCHAMGALTLDWFSGGTTLCSSGQDSALKFWPAAQPDSKPVTRTGRQWAGQLKRRPVGTQLASASGRTVTIWDAHATPICQLTEQTSVIQALAWSHDGALLAAGCTGAVILYRFEGAAVQPTRLDWPGIGLKLAFSPNGRYIAAGMQDGAVRFHRLASQETAEMSGYESKVSLLGWTSNSRFLVTPSGDELIAWDFGGRGPQGRDPLRLRGHTERITALAMHPTKSLAASAGRDWRVAVWEPGANQVPLDVQLTTAEASALCWSGDGRRLAVGQTNGDLAVYELISG